MGIINDDIYAECGDGWNDIILRTHEKLKYIDSDYHIDQIKEKFGGLRYYFTPSENHPYGSITVNIMDDIIRSAEDEASRTCELCGKSGHGANVEIRVDRHWYFGYCEECANSVIAERAALFKEWNEAVN